jgi:hypothetical protein
LPGSRKAREEATLCTDDLILSGFSADAGDTPIQRSRTVSWRSRSPDHRTKSPRLGRWGEGFVSVSFGSASRRDARASLGLGSGRASLITVLAVAR